jgi:hypothetical protein
VSESKNPHGRVDADGTVWVKDGDWRSVGQVVGAEPADALAFYESRFVDLESQVSLLEQRSKKSAPVRDLIAAVEKLVVALTDAHAVGDLASLRTRVGAVAETLGDLKSAQDAANQAASEESLARRTVIVDRAEAIAAQDPEKTHWKNSSTEMAALFQQWQDEQKLPHRVPRKVADELWTRFRAARQSFDKASRAYFQTKGKADKDAKTAKTELCERAEALAPQGAEGIPAYRRLLDEWRKAPRAAQRAVDNQLWDRFKLAGDALYNAGSEEWAANLAAKTELIQRFAHVTKETDVAVAKKLLRELHTAWDLIGQVAKADERAINAKLSDIDRHVRGLEAEHLDRTNPAKVGRREGFAAQVEQSISLLEAEIAAAMSSNDSVRIAALTADLDAKKAWLSALN